MNILYASRHTLSVNVFSVQWISSSFHHFFQKRTFFFHFFRKWLGREVLALSQVDLVLDTNLTSCIKLTRAFVKFMLETNGGHVVNVASIAGQVAADGPVVTWLPPPLFSQIFGWRRFGWASPNRSINKDALSALLKGRLVYYHEFGINCHEINMCIIESDK